MTYSHMGPPTLPSAQLRFTSEFGMGSGGTTTLLSLDKIVGNNFERTLVRPFRVNYMDVVDTKLFRIIWKTNISNSIYFVRDVQGCTNVDVVHG